VKHCSIGIKPADMSLSIQYIAMQKDIAADAPDIRTPVEVWMLRALRLQHVLNAWMAIMVAEQVPHFASGFNATAVLSQSVAAAIVASKFPCWLHRTSKMSPPKTMAFADSINP